MKFLRELIYNLFLICVLATLWGVLVWLPSLQWRFWSPPENYQLTSAEGTFLSRPETNCYSGYCAYPAYTFLTVDGKMLNISCEPAPAWNNCLSGDEPNGLNTLISGAPAQIEYLKEISDPNYNTLMSVKFLTEPLASEKDRSLDFETRINQIRATVTPSYYPQRPNRNKHVNDGLRRPRGLQTFILDLPISAFILFLLVRFSVVGNLFRKK